MWKGHVEHCGTHRWQSSPPFKLRAKFVNALGEKEMSPAINHPLNGKGGKRLATGTSRARTSRAFQPQSARRSLGAMLAMAGTRWLTSTSGAGRLVGAMRDATKTALWKCRPASWGPPLCERYARGAAWPDGSSRATRPAISSDGL